MADSQSVPVAARVHLAHVTLQGVADHAGAHILHVKGPAIDPALAGRGTGRVLYVIDSLAPGGAETSLAELAPGISVLAMIREIKPDLVHTTLYEADIAGPVAARTARLPSSTSLVSDSYNASHRREQPTMRLAAACALDRATAMLVQFHAISASIADSLSQGLGNGHDRVEVIPRGWDPQGYPLRSVDVRRRTRHSLGIYDAVPVVLAVGPTVEVLGPRSGIGLLSNVGDASALARDIITVLRDSKVAARRAQRWRDRFEQYYTVDRVAAQMVDFFQRASGLAAATESETT